MKLLVIFVSLVAFFKLTNAATNYCNSSLCDGSTHIACNNDGSFANVCQANAQILPLNANIRKAIVKKHNTLRNKIAKGGFSGFRPAVRMASMRWNAELAKLAVYNVKQCVMEHDACHNTNQFRLSGQNLAWSAVYGAANPPATQKTILSHIQMWFNEYKDASMQNINSYSDPSSGKVIGHFTEMVLEKNTAIGCAMLRQKKDSGYEFFTACNYAYINVLGRPVYRRGKTGSQCKTGRNPNFKSLCSLKEKYNVNQM